MVSENTQEILERLWMAEEEGEQGLSMAEFSAETMAELIELDLVYQENEWWRLTAAGRPEAAQATRRHRLGERLLADVLSAEDGLLEEQACRLEHVLIDGLDESVCTLLGHPQYCPHGKPIPPGACCREMRETIGRLIAPLCDLHPGDAGKVAYIQMGNSGRLQKLMAMGVLPGGKITLVRRSPSYVFEYGFSQFAVDEEIAGDIYVRLEAEKSLGG